MHAKIKIIYLKGPIGEFFNKHIMTVTTKLCAHVLVNTWNGTASLFIENSQ